MKLPRRRWLVAACVAGAALALAAWWFWPAEVEGELHRRYSLIRVGMSAREAKALLDAPYDKQPWSGGIPWLSLSEEEPPDFKLDSTPKTDDAETRFWTDGPKVVCLTQADGKVVWKRWGHRIPAWQGHARNWLHWLRGLVGL